MNSELGLLNKSEIETYRDEHVGKAHKKDAYVQSARAEFAKRSHKNSPYLLSIPQQIKAVMVRRVQIIKGNALATGLNLVSFIFQGIIMGTVFLNSKDATSAYFSRGGVLYFALLFSALSAMAEIPSLYSQRPIVLRHDQAALYHPFVEAMALTLVDFPISLVTTIVFANILYWMVGLQASADQFFVFLLFLFSMTLTMKGWFRATAAAFKSEATAQTVAGISVLALAIYTGYTIPKPSMIGALRWITYINPLKYGFESIMTNEFRTIDGVCSNLVPQGPGYENITLDNQVCTTVGSLPGRSTVDGNRFVELSYGFKWSNTWMNFGIVVAFGAAFLAALLIFTEFNTSLSTDTSVVLFKRSTKPKPKRKAGDEEKGDFSDEKTPTGSVALQKRPSSNDIVAPAMTDIFSWQNINYTVPIPGKEDRQLLDSVSGYVAPGKLTALMGESGAGKTTLLNVLAMRTDTGVITGDLFVNGQAVPADFQSQTGYVQQMDTHVPFNTVREALLFSAKLRQPPSVPLSEKEAYIHQPSSELFQVFDRLLLLRKGGQTVYFGDIGHNATTLIDYFYKNGARECQPEENPAEYMLDVIGAGATATSAQDWYALWKTSPEVKALQEELYSIHVEGRNRPAVEAAFHSEFATFFFMERPSFALMGAFAVAQVVSSIIAAYGDWGFTQIHSISGGWIGIIWVWNIIWFIPLDWIKFAMKATVIKRLHERRLGKTRQEVAAKAAGVPITRTQSRAASIHESLYSNRTNFLKKAARKVGFKGKVKVHPEELQRFSSIQAHRSGQTLARHPSRQHGAVGAAA
ncbi:hypothetical protein NLJ89_g8894 [Agrocybe chaxingu]|uniref:ABC transporter domain-containing protein n=1 Tax=Agrocybe chaxingu TaxID=84603 RepID=A0A9W8JTH9_9AGAR|nr:hypothetical protein NLJ89_g8894 [Agrocybe chaxingu]